jgi:hypothetical protein
LGADVIWVPVGAPDHLSGAVLGAGDALGWLDTALATVGVPA